MDAAAILATLDNAGLTPLQAFTVARNAALRAWCSFMETHPRPDDVRDELSGTRSAMACIALCYDYEVEG